MKILFGKQHFEIHPGDDYSIAHIKSILTQETGYDSIRLVSGGKTLADDILVHAIPGGIHAKLVMIASHSDELTAPNPIEVRAKNDLTSSRMPVKQSVGVVTKREFVKDGYGFHGVQPLAGLPEEDRAREILETLASDPGFLAVMKKHGWNVGSLGELYPEGYVGVSEVCVLGLNKNKGQEILLRIRTDDLKGFRKMLTIREVLCHELAHMEHSDHDDDFYRLMRVIQREVIELDWTKSRYYTLGEARPNPSSRWLEGEDEEKAISRESIEKMEETVAAAQDEAMDEAATASENLQPAEDIPPPIEAMIEAEVRVDDNAVVEPSSSNSAHMEGEQELQRREEEQLQRLRGQYIAVLERLDGATAAALAQEGVSSLERLLAFIDSIRSFTQHQLQLSLPDSSSSSSSSTIIQQREDWEWSLRLLHKILVNAKDSSSGVQDEKKRALRKDSNALQRLLRIYRPAVDDSLRLAGFIDDGSDHLRIRSLDPGFLYFAAEILHTSIEVVSYLAAN
jgi:hypothetical protein